MHEKLLTAALNAAARKSGFNMAAARAYLKTHAPDRRFQLYAIAGICAWNWNSAGVIQYAGRKYDYRQTPAGFIVFPTI